MEITNEKQEKMTFKQYFEGLSDEKKAEIKKELLKFYTESHFYNCIRNQKYSKPFKHIIEATTQLNFDWNENR